MYVPSVSAVRVLPPSFATVTIPLPVPVLLIVNLCPASTVNATVAVISSLPDGVKV